MNSPKYVTFHFLKVELVQLSLNLNIKELRYDIPVILNHMFNGTMGFFNVFGIHIIYLFLHWKA